MRPSILSFTKPHSFILSKLSFSSIPNYKLSISSNYEKLLEICVSNKDLLSGKLIHSKIVTKGLEQDPYFATKLINLYSQCGEIRIAETIFTRVSYHNNNVYILNAMIRGYCVAGLHRKGLDLFYVKTGEGGVKPDSYTFSCVMKVCGLLCDVEICRDVHKFAFECGLDSDLFVSNAVIAMYGRCGCVIDGVQVFDEMLRRDIVSWNSVISLYIDNGLDLEAVGKVKELMKSGLRPDRVTILNVLSICSSVRVVREIHGYSVMNGYESSNEVCNTLISMYGKYGRIEEARSMFNRISTPDNVAWNALISSYAQNGYFEESKRLLMEMKVSGFDADVVTYSGIISSLCHNTMSTEALSVFMEMLGFKLKPDVVTMASILPAISDLRYVDYGKEIHGYTYRHRMEPDRRIRNSLISLYDKCGMINYAACVFAQIKDRDVISWSSMVVGYVQNGYFFEAYTTFREMVTDKVQLNPIPITSILSACAAIFGTRQGKEVHTWVIKNGYEDQTVVGSALIDMYAKCGNIISSKRVFNLITERDTVICNSMISGYAAHGLAEEALEIFHDVKEPDHVSFIAILSACNHGGLVDEGIKIFNGMKDFGVTPMEGHYACVVDILGRSSRIEEALKLVQSMPVEATSDVWGALLGASKIHSNFEVGVYGGTQLMDLRCERPGHYVMLSNILAGCHRWDEAEVMRTKMNDRGMKKGAGCSYIEVNKIIHSFIASEKTQHPESSNLFKVLWNINEHAKEIG
ncbi:hypothetical protein ACHQM5_018400 [Ranunculus cassubicifolius]